MVTSLFEDSLMLAEQQLKSDDDGVPVLRRMVGDATIADQALSLQLAFLGCEEAIGYGPVEHTASIFLDLLCQAVTCTISPRDLWTISLFLYNAKKQEYPTTRTTTGSSYWEKRFSGVILPGSYSSAYEQGVDWIDKLKHFIQHEIVPQKIPTLAICFGHQIMAQSFYPHGKVSKLSSSSSSFLHPNMNSTNDIKNQNKKEKDSIPEPSLPPSETVQYTSATKASSSSSLRAGRVSLCASPTGQSLLGKPVMHFYATHGDYVEKLPETAVCLGGDEMVPIQAAAYFSTVEEAQQAARLGISNNAHDDRDSANGNGVIPRPFAVTFQSHLEYASSRDLGLHRTLELIMDQMVNRGELSVEDRYIIQQDARETYPQVQRDSVQTMVVVGQILGWFPPCDDKEN